MSDENISLNPNTPSELTPQMIDLKSQILNELKETKPEKSSSLNWNSAIVTLALVLLAVLSLVQVAQSAQIYGKIKSGALNAASTGVGSQQNAPDMVGGC